MIGAVLLGIVDGALGEVRDRLDDFSVAWIVRRRTFPRALAASLLEHLAEKLGARVEYSDPG